MKRHRVLSVTSLLFLGLTAAYCQGWPTGTSDYALGNSSVMWMPRSTALFVNPGELARLHQDEFQMTSGRFESLASMSSSVFIPNTGTFALGAVPGPNATAFSLGYGRLVWDYSTVGAALSVLPKEQQSLRFSVGGAMHLPGDGPESGLHAGLGITNLPSTAIVHAGLAYWVVRNFLRLQVATQSRTQRAEFVGAEAEIGSGVRLLAGTRGFKKAVGGLTYSTSYASLELGGGPEGISFTVNVRIGDAASDVHDETYDKADDAYADGRFGEARELYRRALAYDEYDESSRQLAFGSQEKMDSTVTALLHQAREDEGKHRYAEAMHAYAQILKVDPEQSTVSADMVDIQKKVTVYVQQLLAEGDSLKSRHDIAQARRAYERALDLDPGNDSVSVRIDELENLSKENVRSMLARARTYLRKNQLEDAEREYQRVLAADPDNAQARSGMRTIQGRRLTADLASGKDLFNAGKYIDALEMFSTIVTEHPDNKEAKDWLDKSRHALKEDADKLFKTGLQFYIKEDFKSAIDAWNKVLLIMPSDSSTLEYRKRAEEKLKALEQFK